MTWCNSTGSPLRNAAMKSFESVCICETSPKARARVSPKPGSATPPSGRWISWRSASNAALAGERGSPAIGSGKCLGPHVDALAAGRRDRRRRGFARAVSDGSECRHAGEECALVTRQNAPQSRVGTRRRRVRSRRGGRGGPSARPSLVCGIRALDAARRRDRAGDRRWRNSIDVHTRWALTSDLERTPENRLGGLEHSRVRLEQSSRHH